MIFFSIYIALNWKVFKQNWLTCPFPVAQLSWVWVGGKVHLPLCRGQSLEETHPYSPVAHFRGNLFHLHQFPTLSYSGFPSWPYILYLWRKWSGINSFTKMGKLLKNEHLISGYFNNLIFHYISNFHFLALLILVVGILYGSDNLIQWNNEAIISGPWWYIYIYIYIYVRFGGLSHSNYLFPSNLNDDTK